MKINLDHLLLGTDGQPLPVDEKAPDGAKVDLKRPVMQALLQPRPTDSQTAGLGYRLYQVAQRCKDGGEVELDAGEIDLIKTRIEAFFPPWVVGQAWDLLEGRGVSQNTDNEAVS